MQNLTVDPNHEHREESTWASGFTSGALAWNVVNNPLTRPTGCATRLLLGVNRLLNHCRSPHAPKGGGSGFPAERWDSLRDALLEKDGPNWSSLPEHFSLFDIRTSSHRF